MYNKVNDMNKIGVKRPIDGIRKELRGYGTGKKYDETRGERGDHIDPFLV